MPEDQPGAAASPGESDWRRRRRLARVFGDTAPDTTRDERDEAGADGSDATAATTPPEQRESAGDRWLKAQVPPHHG